VPRGVPEALLAPVPDAAVQLVRRWARTHGPFAADEPAARLGLPAERVAAVLAELAAAGTVVSGGFRPGGRGREWCDAEVLRRLRQRSLAALRREVEPTSAEALARFLPAWQGVGSPAGGLGRTFEVVAQLQGVPVPASVLEADVLAARVAGYTPRLLDELLAAGEVMWAGAGPLGRADGKVVLHLRGSPLARAPGPPAGDRPAGAEHDRLRAVLAERGACFFRDLGGADDRQTLDALWDLVWAGEVTNDSFAPVRAVLRGRPPARGRPRPGRVATLGPPAAQGRWSLVERGGPAATEVAAAQAAALLERHGVLTREAVRGEGVPGGFAGLYPVLAAMEQAGRIRRGYFVTGLGGAQFALPGAVDRLRAARPEAGPPAAVLLAATDPANPFGVALPWPAAGPRRAAGASVVVVDGRASLYLERGGRSLIALRDADGTWEAAAVAALADLASPAGSGRARRLTVADPPSALVPHLAAAGFVPTPRGLALYPALPSR